MTSWKGARLRYQARLRDGRGALGAAELPEAAQRLCDAGFEVSLETSGAMDIAAVDSRVSRVVDVKTPGSREAARNRIENFALLATARPVEIRDLLARGLRLEQGVPAGARTSAARPAAARRILFSPSYTAGLADGAGRMDTGGSPAGAFSTAASQGVVGRRARQVTSRVRLCRSAPSYCCPADWIPPPCSPWRVRSGFDCYALSVQYGQRHGAELDAARLRRRNLGCPRASRHGRRSGGDRRLRADRHGHWRCPNRPPTAFPSPTFPRAIPCSCRWRSAGPKWSAPTIFSWASMPSTIPAIRIAGRSSSRRSNIWPESRPRPGSREAPFKIHAPLIDMSKADIIRAGVALGVDFSMTVSCYQADADGPGLRQMRFLPAARGGFCCGRYTRSHALPLTGFAGDLAGDFGYDARLHWDGSSVGRARPF